VVVELLLGSICFSISSIQQISLLLGLFGLLLESFIIYTLHGVKVLVESIIIAIRDSRPTLPLPRNIRLTFDFSVYFGRDAV
jgi:hypothetical protein